MPSDEDKIFGLIVQAQEMQKFVLEFQSTAEQVLKSLPEASRSATSAAAKEYIVQGAEKASKSLLAASDRVKAASDKLEKAISFAKTSHFLILILVAMILAVGTYFGFGFMIKRQAAELDDLKAQAQEMQKTIDKLNKQYGKVEISTCGQDKRPCVRVDEKIGSFGDPKKGETFYVLYGY